MVISNKNKLFVSLTIIIEPNLITYLFDTVAVKDSFKPSFMCVSGVSFKVKFSAVTLK